MLEPLFALLRRRGASGKVAIVDVEPGRVRTMGLYEPPATEEEIEAFRLRSIAIHVPCQYGRHATVQDPVAAKIFREFMRQREVLAELVTLERYLQEHGPDDHYRRCHREVWAKATALVPDKTST
jgi:hypothetical protein